MDDIENSEIAIMEIEEQEKTQDYTKKKRLLANELKLRVNRLTEEYNEIVKVLPLNKFEN